MKKSLMYVIVLGLLSIIIFAGPATAFAPQPEPPYIGKINSINNQVSSVDLRMNAALAKMGIAPSPFQPVVNQLESENKQLALLSRQVTEVLAALDVQGMDEDPIVLDALTEVLDGVQTISADTENNVGGIGGIEDPEVRSSLNQIKDTADAIAGQIEGFITAGTI